MSEKLVSVSPVLSKVLTNGDEVFDGTKQVPFSGVAGPEISGTIMLVAHIFINSINDVLNLFHYIISHNKSDGDNTDPEIYLRIRGRGSESTVGFECGSWVDQVNHLVRVPLDKNKHIGKELYIVGLYDGTAWKLCINGVLVGSSTDTQGAVAVKNAQWMIGSHNLPAKPRYFIGKIFSAAVYDQILTKPILLQTDSDNNGYINSDKNADREKAELTMGTSVPKPITYFPNPDIANNNPPDAYRHAPLKVDAPNGTILKFECTDNLAISEKTATGYVDVDLSVALDLTKSYYARAIGADPANREPATTGFDKVKLFMYGNATDPTTKVEFDSVVFNARQTLADWNVPSGWIIGDDNSLTTIVPAPDAIGPQSEGSGYITTATDSTEKNGYVFSKITYEEGFKLTLTYSFTRNGDKGYVQPDTSKDERIDNNDTRKISFVGNSGIKLGSFRGAGDGVFEVAILDTKAMVDRVNVKDTAGIVYSQLDAFKQRNIVVQTGTTTTFNYAGVPNDGAKSPYNRVPFLSNMISQGSLGNYEELARLLNGIGYNQPLNEDVYDYANAIPQPGDLAWQKLYLTLQNNYNNCKQTGNEMEIYWQRTSAVGDDTVKGHLRVYMILSGIRTLYYEKTEVTILNAVPEETKKLDGRIYIQTHWGSGVEFENIQIGPYTPPPTE
ncbi:MAG: LamG domain-containing protein [Planctomycetaceae bacterium]|jgi:hypothetical protein|nr:LamG domain-containing protein [Planctomycetaceae bacterium]